MGTPNYARVPDIETLPRFGTPNDRTLKNLGRCVRCPPRIPYKVKIPDALPVSRYPLPASPLDLGVNLLNHGWVLAVPDTVICGQALHD